MTSETASTSESASSDQRPARSAWPETRALAVDLCHWLTRPRVRLIVSGAVLILAGGVFVTSSMWTLPLLIAGALMVGVGWVGRRLDGRLAVEWGETGTQLEFRAQIKAPEPSYRELPAASPTPRPVPSSEPEAEPEDADVVEGEAHTVEIEVAELKALMAAAAAADTGTTHPEAGAHAARGLRVANGSVRAADAAR